MHVLCANPFLTITIANAADSRSTPFFAGTLLTHWAPLWACARKNHISQVMCFFHARAALQNTKESNWNYINTEAKRVYGPQCEAWRPTNRWHAGWISSARRAAVLSAVRDIGRSCRRVDESCRRRTLTDAEWTKPWKCAFKYHRRSWIGSVGRKRNSER